MRSILIFGEIVELFFKFFLKITLRASAPSRERLLARLRYRELTKSPNKEHKQHKPSTSPPYPNGEIH